MNRDTARRLVNSYLEKPVATALNKLGVSPNAVTMMGLVGAGVSAYLISIGQFWAGGVVMLLAGILDLFDGALARLTGRASRFGALLDSVADRVSEIIVLLGLLVFYVQGDSTRGTVLVYLAVTGSIMVSYLRARSEGLGIENKVGIMTRPERVVILGVGLIVGHWVPVVVEVILGIIAALTIFTTGQRLFHTWQTLRDEDSVAG